MAYFVRVKDQSGYEILVNIDLVTKIKPYGGGGAWLEFASEHQQSTLIGEDDYQKVLKEIEIAE